MIVLLYIIAALFNLRIPRTDAPLQPLAAQRRRRWCATSRTATRACGTTSSARSRWRRRRCSGASRATCAYIVFAWAAAALGYTTTQASSLVGVVAIGTAAGAVVASMRMRLDQATRVIPLGIAMGVLVIGDELHHATPGSPAPFLIMLGAHRRLPGGADERAAAAPRRTT